MGDRLGTPNAVNSEHRRWCVEVEVDVLGSPSLIVVVLTVSLDVCNTELELGRQFRAQELCESGGGRPELPVPNSPYDLCGRKATLNCSISEFRSCVKVEVAVLSSPSLIVRTISAEVKQHWTPTVSLAAWLRKLLPTSLTVARPLS